MDQEFSHEKIERLARRARRYVKDRRTLILDCSSPEADRVTLGEVQSIAERAGCDWLYNDETGEARFFEGN